MPVTKRMMWLCLPVLLAAVPAGAQVVSGTVVGDHGAPVPFASVVVAERDGSMVAATSTDRGGRFSVHLPAGGSYRLRVMGDVHIPADVRFNVADGATSTHSIRLRMHGGGTVAGSMPQRPLGPDGRPQARPAGSPGGTGGARPAPAGQDN
jgi:hypothetical protein